MKRHTFATLLKAIARHGRGSHFLKTAIETGFLTDGQIAFRLTDEEMGVIREEVAGKPDVKDGRVLPVMEMIPHKVGPILDFKEEKEIADEQMVAVLTRDDKTFLVAKHYYVFLTNRYPKATWHAEASGTRVIVYEWRTVAIVASLT